MSEFCTVSQVKAFLGITANTDDALLLQLIEAQSTFIESWCSRSFISQFYIERFSGNGRAEKSLQFYPVQSVQSVMIGLMVLDEVESMLENGFVLNGNQVILTKSVFQQGFMNCVIEYNAGYDYIPLDIQHACIELVATRYKAKERIGMTSKGMAGETTAFDVAAMPSHVKEILRQYKNVARL